MPEDEPHSQPADLEHIWNETALTVRREVGELTFHIWLAPLSPAALVAGTLYLRAPDHIRTWVSERYSSVLCKAVSAVELAHSVEVVPTDWEPPEDPARSASTGPPGPNLNARYTFDQFVICDGNRLAHAAALAVAELPSQAYNPLFIHGRPGLGKTHLLHAIGNYVSLYGAGLTVRYTTVEEFTSAFVASVRGGDAAAFRERFRSADVLLIDDIQFLAEKLRTEEEFFHTFNALYESGRQLVITSDRRPRDIEALETRLRERFEHGLVAELESPDFDARMAILQTRARLDAVHDVPTETLAEICNHVTSSVRTLEGALIRVVAYASLRGERPTPELAGEVLRRLYPRDAAGTYTLDAIQTAAADVFAVDRARLLAQDRTARVALARQVAMYIARELTDETLPAIGRGFGGRNHSTVLHAHQRIAERLASDPATAEAVDALRARLREATDDRRC